MFKYRFWPLRRKIRYFLYLIADDFRMLFCRNDIDYVKVYFDKDEWDWIG